MIFDSRYSCCQIKQKTIVSKEMGNEHILHNNVGFPVFQYHIKERLKDISKTFGEK